MGCKKNYNFFTHPPPPPPVIFPMIPALANCLKRLCREKCVSVLQVVSAKVEQARDKAEAYRGPQFNKDRCFTLLVIDDQNTDWSVHKLIIKID